jgi:hypothetical protein
MEKISERSGEEEDSNMLNRSEKYETMVEVNPSGHNSIGKTSAFIYQNGSKMHDILLNNNEMQFEVSKNISQHRKTHKPLKQGHSKSRIDRPRLDRRISIENIDIRKRCDTIGTPEQLVTSSDMIRTDSNLT